MSTIMVHSILFGFLSRVVKAYQRLATLRVLDFVKRTYNCTLTPDQDLIKTQQGYMAFALGSQFEIRPDKKHLIPGRYLMSYTATTKFPDSIFVPKSTLEALPNKVPSRPAFPATSVGILTPRLGKYSPRPIQP